MAETFSIGEALAAPVRVIRRHPLAVFVWGLTMVVFSLVLSGLIFGSLADLPLTADGSAEASPEGSAAAASAALKSARRPGGTCRRMLEGSARRSFTPRSSSSSFRSSCTVTIDFIFLFRRSRLI